MNTENMLKLADLLDNVKPAKFNMGSWCQNTDGEDTSADHVGECGTTACIAGWAVVVAIPEPIKRIEVLGDDQSGIAEFARDFLGLTEKQTDYLFYGDWRYRIPKADRLDWDTPKRAAEAVRYLAANPRAYDLSDVEH